MRFLSIVSAAILAVTLLASCANKNSYIGIEHAKSIAFKNAGVSESEINGIDAELDRDHNYVIYDISFVVNGYEYEYEIDAESGEVVRSFRELDDDTRLPTPTLVDDTKPEQSETSPVTELAPDAEPAPVTEAPEPATAVEPVQAPETAPIAVVSEPVKDNTPALSTDTTYIGRDKAKEIALGHAGLAASDVYGLESELDRERGVIVYDVSFDANGYDYDYEIDALTGDILRSDKEWDDDYIPPRSNSTNNSNNSNSSNNSTANDFISRDKAKEIALNHAGLKETDVYDLDVELEYEHGKDIYEVSFDSAGYEYDYEIDAISGEILKNKKDRD